MLSACWLIGAYFLAVSSHKRGRLNTSVYGMEVTYEYVTVAIVHGEHREPQRSVIATREDSKALL